MDTNIVIPKKDKFDIALARKKSSFPISVFKVLGYTVDFTSIGDIVFTNDGSNVFWYMQSYTGNSITVKAGNSEIYFAIDKKTYHVDFTIKGLFEFNNVDKEKLNSVFGTTTCIIDVDNIK